MKKLKQHERIDALVARVNQLHEEREALVAAIRLIVDRWEDGDLAEAVRHADRLTREKRSKA